MKVVILAGGLGTRIATPGVTLPKPLLEISDRPIIEHIMEGFSQQGLNEFVVALGFKGDQVKQYFLSRLEIRSDINIDFSSGVIHRDSEKKVDWQVSLVDTGKETMTGGRLKRLGQHLQERFLLTYGDGLCNVNIAKLIAHHEESKALMTITAVNPTSRYGEVEMDATGKVQAFSEKPEFTDDWISGGYMVVEPEVIELIDGDHTVLEADVMTRLAAAGQMAALKHRGFWHCMDTLRDKASLEELSSSGRYPWLEIETST